MSEIVSLAEKYKDYFKIGAAVNPRSIAKYGDLIKKHFNSLTCENEMKFISVQPERGVFTFDAADTVANFARENGIPMRGHTFVWHGQTPRWIFEDKESAYEELAKHMETVGGRYADIVYAWDVVNEAANDADGGNIYRERSPWYGLFGESYLKEAFKMAKRILPAGTKLVYNDYNESNPGKRDRIIEMIRRINDEGILVDTVGMQSHWRPGSPSLDMICEAIEKYAAEGLRIHITELDVSMHEWNEAPGTVWDTPERAEEHAKYYGDIFAIFRKHKDHIDSVTLWGVTDGTSWLNGFPVRGRPDKALLFTDDGMPKEAFYRVIDF